MRTTTMTTNDSKQNYRTKPGVDVEAQPRSGGGGEWVVKVSRGTYFECSIDAVDALFEPIPRPVMMTMPLDLARRLRADVNRAVRLSLTDSDELERLISAAEQQSKIVTTTECTRSAKL
jgi:hypothetical protein